VSDLADYFHAQDKTRLARANVETASSRLELASIKERMAELRSQYEPLSSLLPEGASTADRERILAAIFYVVIGRFPE
jgi:hypothetical protein